MKFNERLKYLREKKGYTQDEIASRLNISRQSVSKWENGINEPDIETIKKLCNILDCSIVELIDDESKIITTKEAEAININKIYQFTKSQIWKEMIQAKEVQREKPFYINIPAKEIYKSSYQLS